MYINANVYCMHIHLDIIYSLNKHTQKKTQTYYMTDGLIVFCFLGYGICIYAVYLPKYLQKMSTVVFL